MSRVAAVQEIAIPLAGQDHAALLGVPDGAHGIVVFAHGSGSSRLSPRNNYVAEVLRDAGMATLLFDLLTEAEDRDYERRFDIGLLTKRLAEATQWLQKQDATRDLAIGYFGASTGGSGATGSGRARFARDRHRLPGRATGSGGRCAGACSCTGTSDRWRQ
jgi:putative phosphoribosyl transferase